MKNFKERILNKLNKGKAEKKKQEEPDKTKTTFEGVFEALIVFLRGILVVSILLILFSGVYKVNSGEVAVVLRLGKIAGNTIEEQIKKPGLHFAFPFVIDKVVKIPVETIQEKSVSTHCNLRSQISPDVRNTGYLITGDHNFVCIDIKVKYRIENPIDYTLNFNDNEQIINGIVSGECTALVAQMMVDPILTTEKELLANNLRKSSQSIFDEIGFGIRIVNIELIFIAPPTETVPYFNKVNISTIAKQTLIKKARDYQLSLVPEKEKEAKAIVEDSKVRQEELLLRAKEEMAQFDGLYEQYSRNPKIIENTIFQTRVSQLLGKSGSVFIVPKEGGSPRIVLP